MINKFWKIIEWWTCRVGVAAVCVRCRLSCGGFGCYGVACWPESIGGLRHWFSVPRSVTFAVVVVVCITLPSSSLIFLFGTVVRAVGCVVACHIHVYCLKYALQYADKGLLVFIYNGYVLGVLLLMICQSGQRKIYCMHCIVFCKLY